MKITNPLTRITGTGRTRGVFGRMSVVGCAFVFASVFGSSIFVLSSRATASETAPDELLDCLIEPWVVSDVGSPIQGVIKKLLVDRGEQVEKGQPVAQLESNVESADVALAEIRSDTQFELGARDAELKLALLEQARVGDLYKQKMVTAQQRDEANARVKIARAAQAQAKVNLSIQQLELNRAQHQFARRILTSPLDGVVVATSAFAGEFVYDNPVMTIAALDPLRVEVMLPARLFGTIVEGDVAELFPELGGSTLEATVDVVDALLDSRSGTFGVRLKLSNPDYKIPAGQRCQIAFEPKIAAAHAEDTASAEKQ